MKPETNNSALKKLHVLRQAFFLASMLIIVGLVCTYAVHPYFSVLPLIVACGLLFTSLVGWCPMIYILERMPWNRTMDNEIKS